MRITHTFTLNTKTTAVELAARLASMYGYRLRKSSADGTYAHARVGSRFLLHMIGCGVYNKYTAPVQVEIHNTPTETTVHLRGAPGLNFIAENRVNEFYQRTFDQIESRLTAADS